MSAENNEEVVVVERDLVVVENDEIVLEIVEIEEYVREGRPVPKARMYRYRVNKQKFDTDKEEITGAEILERAGLVPVKDYRLRKKRRNGPPEEVKPEEIVHLREHGVERFVAQHKHVQDGRGGRSEFAVGEEDRDFLDGLGLKWEALKVPVPNGPGPRLWIVIYQVPIPGGLQRLGGGCRHRDRARLPQRAARHGVVQSAPRAAHRANDRLRPGRREDRRPGLAALVAPSHRVVRLEARCR